MKMDILSNKAFITGLSGFTGYHLANFLLDQKWEICGLGLYNNSSTLHAKLDEKDKIVEFLKEQKPTYIFHLAGVSFVGHQNQEDFYKVNTIGTQHLLDAIVESKIEVQKVILASSATVYGNQSSFILSEDMIPNPNNHYGISKLAMEFMAKTYFDKLPIIITRPFNYTGVGHSEDFIVPKIVKHFREQKMILEIGNIKTLREFNDVAWVCDIYWKLAMCSTTSEIVNIASGKTQSIESIIKKLTEISKHELEIKVNPRFVRENEIYELKGSVEKLKTMIDIHFFENQIDDLLEKMLIA
jgi:nucleoside-diphosphate-sugar epimerase